MEKLEGVRELKRTQTLNRIAEVGLKLFVENGYEATTLDAIAEAAGISRRTFFYYFKSKEDVLLAHDGSGFSQAIHSTMLAQSASQTPLHASRNCLLKLASHYETDESIVVDRLLRSTEALRARKESTFIEVELALVEAMRELYPASVKRDALRVVAMIAMGMLRLALDNWRDENGKNTLSHYVRRNFELLEKQI